MLILSICNRSGLVICYNCNFQEMGRVIVGCHDTTYRMVCMQSTQIPGSICLKKA